jgi:hypothetical protein
MTAKTTKQIAKDLRDYHIEANYITHDLKDYNNFHKKLWLPLEETKQKTLNKIESLRTFIAKKCVSVSDKNIINLYAEFDSYLIRLKEFVEEEMK